MRRRPPETTRPDTPFPYTTLFRSIVGTLKTLALQQIMDPRHPQPLAPAAHLILFQQCVQAILKRPDPRQRLNLALIVECAFRRPDRLADHLPRHMQIPRDRLDRLTTGILETNPHSSLQNKHHDKNGEESDRDRGGQEG